MLAAVAVVLIGVGFVLSFFVFNPVGFFIGDPPTFRDHVSHAALQAGLMAFLVVPAALLGFKSGTDA
ncbi:hypothetical protein [Tateyamaria omphalii]|uniref:hypothetical protein n=1 Tax=Tateyamaria omphalii TaxID=299262 RepID=UPI001671B57E|nr:hypothetical protein [Tateyamaria omphalii]